jgi:hypothetical protein
LERHPLTSFAKSIAKVGVLIALSYIGLPVVAMISISSPSYLASSSSA